MERQAAQPAVRGRHADAHAGADRAPQVVAVGQLDGGRLAAGAGRVDHAVHVVGVEVLAELDIGAAARPRARPRSAPPARGATLSSSRSMSGAGRARVERNGSRAELRERVQQDHVIGRGLQDEGHPVARRDARAGHPAGHGARLALELRRRSGSGPRRSARAARAAPRRRARASRQLSCGVVGRHL